MDKAAPHLLFGRPLYLILKFFIHSFIMQRIIPHTCLTKRSFLSYILILWVSLLRMQARSLLLPGFYPVLFKGVMLMKRGKKSSFWPIVF